MIWRVFDTHSHIVPGVDDGSLNVTMSIELLRNAYKQGVCDIICTSHRGCDIVNYVKNLKQLQKQIKNRGININLYYGCEIYCDDYIIEDIIKDLNYGNILSLNGTKYVLIEFDPYETADIIFKCVQSILKAGYIPIIAHTERHFGLLMEPKYINRLQERGCLFQLNAYSIVNEHDKIIKEFAIRLLKEKVISFIGSDAHRTNHRPYMIRHGISYIYKHCDIKYANDICYKNAQRLLSSN